MTEIILDTNFIIYCVKNKIYFEEEIKNLVTGAEIVMITAVKEELKKIVTDHQKKYRLEDRELASLSLQITGKYREIKTSGKYADKEITNYAQKNKEKKVIVATNDAKLAEKLPRASRIIKVRGIKQLIIE